MWNDPGEAKPTPPVKYKSQISDFIYNISFP